MILGPGDRPTASVRLSRYSYWASSSANAFCGLSRNAPLKNATFGCCSVARPKASANSVSSILRCDWPASASLLAFHHEHSPESRQHVTPKCTRRTRLRRLKPASQLLLLLVAFGRQLFLSHLLMQILFADAHDSKSHGDGGEDGRGKIRITKPAEFVQSLEDIFCQSS